MKKPIKKLALARHTIRTLGSNELDAVAGGDAVPTTTVLSHRAAAATPPCRLTGTVNTAPCAYTL